MKIYWKKEFYNYADTHGVKHLQRITCPNCGAFWERDMFVCLSDIAFAGLFTYCPDCGKKNIETNAEILARARAEAGFKEYWTRFNEEVN